MTGTLDGRLRRVIGNKSVRRFMALTFPAIPVTTDIELSRRDRPCRGCRVRGQSRACGGTCAWACPLSRQAYWLPHAPPSWAAARRRLPVILPLTAQGNAGLAAQSMKNAAEMALAEFKVSNVQLLVKDDGGSPQGAQS